MKKLMPSVEQACRKHVIGSKAYQAYCRFLKRRANKLFRKRGKELLDEAPSKRLYHGWSD